MAVMVIIYSNQFVFFASAVDKVEVGKTTTNEKKDIDIQVTSNSTNSIFSRIQTHQKKWLPVKGITWDTFVDVAALSTELSTKYINININSINYLLLASNAELDNHADTYTVG